MNQNKIIRSNEVLGQTGLSKSTIDRLEKSGQFPKRVQITTRAVGWYEQDVNSWLKNKKSKSSVTANKGV